MKSLKPVFVFLLIFILKDVLSQENQIEIKQRALFLTNISSSFKWDKANRNENFIFGIYKDKALYNEVLSISKTRKINGIKITPKLISNTYQIRNLDLIYADKSNGDIAFEILNKINTQHILFVGENFKFQECHVNLLFIDSEFIYEINKNRLANSGFTVSNELSNESIESSSKWYALYNQSDKNLSIEKKYNRRLKKEIAAQEKQIKSLASIADSLYKEINVLQTSKRKIIEELTSQRALFDTLQIEIEQLKENELTYRKKISVQLDSLSALKKEIKRQEKILENIKASSAKKTEQIKLQQQSIKTKDSVINRQNYLLLLIVTILIFSLLIAALLFRSNRLKKRNNLLLIQKNKQIQQRKKEMEQFAYAASHDLAAPVNTILGFSLLLSEKGKEYLDDKDLLFLQEITNSSERMKELIKDLLEFAQIGQDGEKEIFYLRPLLDDVLIDLDSDIKEANANMNIHIAEDHKIRARKTEIRRLIQNLLTNALKFKSANTTPSITIHCDQRSTTNVKKTTFSVRDNGIGIEDDYKKKVFNVFSRLHSEEEYAGTGIGLAQCKKIAERHSGEIWVEDNPTGGSVFTFTLREKT